MILTLICDRITNIRNTIIYKPFLTPCNFSKAYKINTIIYLNRLAQNLFQIKTQFKIITLAASIVVFKQEDSLSSMLIHQNKFLCSPFAYRLVSLLRQYSNFCLLTEKRYELKKDYFIQIKLTYFSQKWKKTLIN
ncbi:hypothetical protein TTHERM_000263693 (macronuclear) [Tetrahymena thermophila SB210]|uniref:Uncharacterized protein n=1 Tax=Tetrahymena thermophila (strain SB210) TaxID=312017 RepID=W7XGJ5_TETTS|nr:hypothetical protein TTHERM_000263693 [Tetrahymena thermophila SB210]EWS76118.1 hypothetical protein TTHERM_000263693 [Tetrahymena thermophila SB210]|eukprot:XP_012651358.1 hypothetical protein TTHERM_000263693 [Tetrahymena thermophila SB210]